MAALIVIGCIFTVEPVIPEARSIFIKRTFPKSISKNASLNASTSLDDLEYVNFSSDDEEISESENTTEMPWILEKCLENLGKDLSEVNCSTLIKYNIKLIIVLGTRKYSSNSSESRVIANFVCNEQELHHITYGTLLK